MRETAHFRPFRAMLTNGEIHNIRINGSETPKVFSLEADADQDTIITEVRIILHAVGLYGVPGFRQFTDTYTSGLTNGLKLTFTRSGESYEWFNNGPLKKIGNFFNYHDDAFEIEHAIAPDIDTFIVLFKFDNRPIWLGQGSTDKIEFTVQDDLTCLYSGEDSIVMVTGFKEIV
jgi:hypothetical protein